jgi:predicted lipoprotein with Yx(FWY)xxD motif
MGHSSTRWPFFGVSTRKGRRGAFGYFVSRILVVGASFLLFALLSASVSSPASSASTTSARAKVSLLSTNAYGLVLVVGSGALKGAPLYAFSGDQGGKIRCGTSLATGYDLGPITSIPLTCTGPESDLLKGVKSDDWPAFTSVGRPLAGPGINSRLLSAVDRPGVGDQVTYNGHPLYLFDPVSQPFTPQGEGYVETAKPLAPWHGYWFLVSTSGNFAPARATLDQGVLLDGSKVLSVVMDANVSPLDVTLYTFSGDHSRAVVCGGKCSLTWIPLLTHGAPVVDRGVNPRLVGTLRLSNGAEQVTYRGQPLFLYAKEKVFLTPSVHLKSSGTAGNGEGFSTPDGSSSVTIALH